MGEDHAGDLCQRGIARPEGGCLAQFGLEGCTVPADGCILRLGKVHGADGAGGFDGCARLGGVEVLGDGFEVFHQRLSQSIIANIERGNQAVAFLGEF